MRESPTKATRFLARQVLASLQNKKKTKQIKKNKKQNTRSSLKDIHRNDCKAQTFKRPLVHRESHQRHIMVHTISVTLLSHKDNI